MASRSGPVLLVDDDADIREAIRDVLADAGYESVPAGNGQEALDYLLGDSACSLILLDWNMAPMNGAQFMAEVAARPALADIPVVLLTADAKLSEKGKSAAFAGCLAKPVKLDALFHLVDVHCGSSVSAKHEC